MKNAQSTGELNHTGSSRGHNCRRRRDNEHCAWTHLNNKFCFWRLLLYILNRLRHGCFFFIKIISFFMSQQKGKEEKEVEKKEEEATMENFRCRNISAINFDFFLFYSFDHVFILYCKRDVRFLILIAIIWKKNVRIVIYGIVDYVKYMCFFPVLPLYVYVDFLLLLLLLLRKRITINFQQFNRWLNRILIFKRFYFDACFNAFLDTTVFFCVCWVILGIFFHFFFLLLAFLLLIDFIESKAMSNRQENIMYFNTTDTL